MLCWAEKILKLSPNVSNAMVNLIISIGKIQIFLPLQHEELVIMSGQADFSSPVMVTKKILMTVFLLVILKNKQFLNTVKILKFRTPKNLL